MAENRLLTSIGGDTSVTIDSEIDTVLHRYQAQYLRSGV